MGNNKIDLNIIKEQISKRRHEVGATPEQKKQNRDSFLNELLHSRNNGVPTKASEKIKIVEKVSDKVVNGRVPAEHSGKYVDPNLLAHVNTPKQSSQYNPQPVNEGYDERDNRFDSQINSLYDQYRTGAQPQRPQPNQFGMLSEQQVAQLMSERGGTQVPQNGLITEQVGSAINNFINENMGVIVEQAMKNAVMEMYSIERIKKTLDENRDLIQKIVIDTIKMLSDRKKAQAAKTEN